jgi:hypothetical protein
MVPGTDFVHAMQLATTTARRTVAVLSPSYFSSEFGEAEWRVAFASDPTGEKGLLIPVRVVDFEPAGLLATRVYIDLVDKGREAARATLLEGVRGREAAMPAEEPAFPGDQAVAAVEAVGSDDEEPRFPGEPQIWNVPFRRNPAFTGREHALAELAGRLGQGAAAAVTQALQGGGGVGKTALATEYAYRHRSEFDTVWWVRAEEPATLVGDLADLAVALRLAGAGQADQQTAVQAVRRWLDGHDRWLLVLDNAQAPDMPTGLQAPLARLVDLLPQVLHGQLLVTSRDARWEDHAALAELEVFTPEEAVAFLLVRSHSGDAAAAAEIAEVLGWLPLALEQAGAYTRETRIGLRAYLERLQRYPARILTTGRPWDRDPADTVATTWRVSVAQVQPTPGAVGLLEVCAFLSPEEIPRELFATPLNPPADALGMLAEDPFTLDQAIAALHRFGLVKASEQTLTVHRLVQTVVRDGLDPEGRQHRLQTAERLVLAGFPDPPDVAAWPTAARLLPHALAVTDHADAQGANSALTGRLLNRTAVYLRWRAQFTQARALLERALAINTAVLGPEHPEVLTGLDHLGDTLYALRELPAARQAHERP